jgi:hypothetical protein
MTGRGCHQLSTANALQLFQSARQTRFMIVKHHPTSPCSCVCQHINSDGTSSLQPQEWAAGSRRACQLPAIPSTNCSSAHLIDCCFLLAVLLGWSSAEKLCVCGLGCQQGAAPAAAAPVKAVVAPQATNGHQVLIELHRALSPTCQDELIPQHWCDPQAAAPILSS